MPKYCYQCNKCGKTFKIEASIEDKESLEVFCPECESTEVRQKFGTFFSSGNTGGCVSGNCSSCSGCGGH